MSFTSLLFLFLFLPFTLIGYYLFNEKLKNIFLVVVSLIFYSIGEPIMFFVLIITIIVNYLGGLLMDYWCKRNVFKRSVLIGMLLWNIGMLVYYKYLVIILSTTNMILKNDYFILDIALPLGISFFTFRTLSYCLDIFWEIEPAQKNIIDFALYISFFPQLIMGPITKYRDFSKQLKNRMVNVEIFANGIKKIISGLFKKLVIADTIGNLINIIFSIVDSERTMLLAWFGALGYLIQLYYDFSGYSDIAVGLGKIFGFKTSENFNYPYISKSITEFWNRWHITLGEWFKNYIYIPIFRFIQSKKFSIKKCDFVALFVVWLLVGIWHGAGIKFALYGMYYFLFILIERMVENYKKTKYKKLKSGNFSAKKSHFIISHIYFFAVIIFGQLLFRCNTVQSFLLYIRSMFGIDGNLIVDSKTVYYLQKYMLTFIIGALFCFPLIPFMRKLCEKKLTLTKLTRFLSPIIYIGMYIISVSYAFTDTYQAFIYFQF